MAGAFRLSIDSKLHGCDLVNLMMRYVCHGDQVATRATVMQIKNQRPVQFEITPASRETVQAGIKLAGPRHDGFLIPSRNSGALQAGVNSEIPRH